MKKVLFGILLLGSTQVLFAQNSKVISAYNYLKYNELDKAKSAIDEAVVNEKTIGSAKAWFFKGNVYKAISESEQFRSLDANANQIALEAYSKSLELDPKSDYAEEIYKEFNRLKVGFFNNGVSMFNDKNYKGSSENFMKAKTIMELVKVPATDSTYLFSLLYGGMSAEKSGDLASAKILMGKLMELKYNDSKVYTTLASAYKAAKDTAGAIGIIQAGRVALPDDKALLIEELNFFLASGRAKDAIDRLDIAISKDPKNAELLLAKGSMAQKMKNLPLASETYKKAISLNPNSFDANYFYGAMLFNQGAEMNNAANNIKDNKQFEKAKAEAELKLKEAAPYLEKALEVNPKDRDTMMSLKQLYSRVNDTTNYQRIKKLLEQ